MNLTLFLPRNVSLRHWERVGLFDYSIDLYQRLAESGWRIGIVSYGGRSELDYANRLPQFRILCNRWRLTPQAYERALPWLHWRWLRHTRIIKSYQVDGADNAYRAARLWNKPFVARCGYLLSDFALRGGADSRTVERARAVESLTFAAAHRSVVTTPSMRDVIAHDYQVPIDRIRVIPNYVRTDRFSPDESGALPRRLAFVGRLEAQKNPLHLVEACAGLDVELVMIGTGSLESAIRQRARDLGVNLQLPGVRPHAELPSLLRQAALFVLPSSYEGHPKAIIEAGGKRSDFPRQDGMAVWRRSRVDPSFDRPPPRPARSPIGAGTKRPPACGRAVFLRPGGGTGASHAARERRRQRKRSPYNGSPP